MPHEKPINPKKLAKLMLLGIQITKVGSMYTIYQNGVDGWKVLVHGQGSSMPNGFPVHSKTMKRAVSKALQSMDKTRFYWK